LIGSIIVYLSHVNSLGALIWPTSVGIGEKSVSTKTIETLLTNLICCQRVTEQGYKRDFR